MVKIVLNLDLCHIMEYQALFVYKKIFFQNTCCISA